MRVSLNTIKRYTDIGVSVDELVAKINAQLGSVEATIDLGERYKDATIVKVVSCEKHPDADKLSVCKVDTGQGDLVQVVCGAPNVHANMFAVWLPPQSTVPASFDEKELFVLESRELRGVVSNGMLASAKELAIGDSHEGILEIDANDEGVKAGASFAEIYGLDDTLIDIENKMFTHRPDLFGQIGVAREIAGIQHKKFASPKWYLNEPTFESGAGLELEVANEAPEQVPRFMAVAVKNVEVKPSPLWLQAELVRLGSKPINNIVDATNYIMLLTAQPTHAYDYDKLRGHKLISRMAKKGESAKLLNGKIYELDENDIVIADGEGVVGLAGIMGGGESEVSAETKNIVLEVANFDMYTLRRSSMRHGLFTDALTRFNKGQSPLQNPVVLAKLIELIGGEQAGVVFDTGKQSSQPAIDVTVDFVNDRLGLTLSAEEIKKLLTNVELMVENELKITPAFWRTDLQLPEDIVEEIGRLHGYDKLVRALPTRSTKPVVKNAARDLAKTIRDVLARAGANEVLTYSFVHENILKKAGQNPNEAFRLSNALSPDLQYYRLSLLPSLLDKVHANIKAGFDEFTIFEIGKAHHKQNIGDDGLPAEPRLLEIVYTNKKSKQGAAFYQARRTVDWLLENLGIEASIEPITQEMTYAGMAPFDQKRSGSIITKDGVNLGVVGELQPAVRHGFKLPSYTAAATLSLDALEQTKRNTSTYVPLSKYPSTTRDISLETDGTKTYTEVLSTLQKCVAGEKGDDISILITPIAIYRPKDSDITTFTYRIKFTPSDKTLVSDEISNLMDAAANKTAAELGAKIV